MEESRMLPESVGLAPTGAVELLGRAIHRVRNLLMSVRGYAELIAMAPGADPDHRRWAARIVEQVDRLEALQARVDGAMRLEPEIGFHSMAVIARAAVERSDLRADEVVRAIDVRLHVIEDLIVQADGEDVAEALAALIDNAREATVGANSGPVEIELGPTPEGAWALRVTDPGAGLQASDFERLGEAFFTRKAGHLGLGVFLSQALLERHGLQLDYDRSSGDRTVATIRERRIPAGGNR